MNNNFQRDEKTKALINTDKAALEMVKLKRSLAKRRGQEIEQRFKKIEDSIQQIFEILKGN